MVETKSVTDRRELSFATMQDLAADVDALDGGERRTSGNWTDGQIVQHVTKFITDSLDGFDIGAPVHMRIMGRLFRSRVLRHRMKPGFKVPGFLSPYLPGPDITWDEAVAEFRREMQRMRDGERMTAVSPVFGAMTHEQWEQMHCRHAEMHFGFMSSASQRRLVTDKAS